VLGKKLAVDLGTQTVRMVVKGEGAITSEPSVVALRTDDHLTAGLFGGGALRAAAEDSELRLLRPVAGGSLVDEAALRTLLNHVMIRAIGRQRIFKPDVVMTVMAALTGDERRLMLDAAMQSGARTAYLLDAVVAGAIGSGMPVSSAAGHLAIDVGAGKTEIAVLAQEGTVAGRCLAGHGGDRLAVSIAAHVHRKHGVELDLAAAEDIAASLACVGIHEERRFEVMGRLHNAARPVTVTSTELTPVLDAHVRPIAIALDEVLAETPPGLRDDVHRAGIVMFGGAARLEGLDRYLSASCRMRVRVDGEPQLSVIRGTGYSLDNLDVLKRNFMYIR